MLESDLIAQQRSLLRDFRQAEVERTQAESAAEARRLADRTAVDAAMRQRCQTAIGQLTKAREALERGLSALRRAALEHLAEVAVYAPSFVPTETNPVSALERAAFSAVGSANEIEAGIAALQHWQAARVRRNRWLAAVSGVLLIVLAVAGFLANRAWQIEQLRGSAQKALAQGQYEATADILVELNRMNPSEPSLVEMPAAHPDLRAPLIRRYGELWQSGEVFLVRTLGGHKAPVFSVAFSPDGRFLASGGGIRPAPDFLWMRTITDYTVRLWDPADGHTLGLLQGDRPSDSLLFSPYDQTLMSQNWRIGSAPNIMWQTAQLWDLSTGLTQYTTTVASKASSGRREAIGFSPSGPVLAVQSGNAFVIRVSDQRQLYSIPDAGVYGIAFSDDGRLLLTIGDWGREQLWNGVTGEHLYSVSGASCRFVVAPDGQTLATAQCTSTYADLGIWRLDGSETPEFMGARMERGLVDLVFAPDSTLLAAGAMYSIQVWDVVGKRKTRDFFVISDNVSSLIFSPDNETLVAGTGKGSLKFWDVSSGTELRTVRGHKGPVHGLAFSPDGRFLASAGDDATVKLWSAR